MSRLSERVITLSEALKSHMTVEFKMSDAVFTL